MGHAFDFYPVYYVKCRAYIYKCILRKNTYAMKLSLKASALSEFAKHFVTFKNAKVQLKFLFTSALLKRCMFKVFPKFMTSNNLFHGDTY